MPNNRAMHAKRGFARADRHDLQNLSWHLLKFHEILDACTMKLPRLQTFELQQHTYREDELLLARIKATNKDGILWVIRSDVHFETTHSFYELGYEPYYR
jgi:hypothetical protein